jgi:hypothetical protein
MRGSGLALAILFAASSAASAANRAFTPALACRAIANIVARDGAVVLGAGGGEFDRYVSDDSHCALGEAITPAWVRAADNSSCFIGFTCEQYHE